MSQRKTIEKAQHHFNKVDALTRQKQEKKLNEFGVPLPPAYSWNNRRVFAIYKRIESELLRKRIIQYADGDAIWEAAKLTDAGRSAEAGAYVKARWGDRTPAPEPAEALEAGITLEAFLASIVRCRATFKERMSPAATVCLDENGEPYTWPEGDALTIARGYAQDILAGRILGCELLKHACARFVHDLEHAHERGWWIDPWEARLVCTWFKTFCRIDLLPWEVWLLSNLMAFKAPSGLRRYREAWCFIARKNGKTSLAAGLGLWFLICDQELRAEVYSTATKATQSAICFKDAVHYVKAHPELRKHCTVFKDIISVDESTFQPLSCDLRGMEGLRPSCILADEVAVWQDRQQWTVMTTGQVARVAPLVFAFTTPGEARRGFAWERYEIVCRILKGTLADDRVLPAVWQLDDSSMDYRNPEHWVAANPSLGTTVTVESLQKQLSETVADVNSLPGFLRYQCGIWNKFVKANATFSPAKVEACASLPTYPEMSPRELQDKFIELNKQTKCWAGWDFGEVSDLACLSLLFPNPVGFDGTTLQGYVAALAFFWAPEMFLQEKEKKWKVPLQQFHREGWLDLCSGDLNDPDYILTDIVDILGNFNCKGLGGDPWHSRATLARLAEMSRGIEVAEVPQSPSHITGHCVDFKTTVLAGKFSYLGNPAAKWMLGNVILEKHGRFDAIVPEKMDKDPANKIDFVQATISAWHRWKNTPPEMSFGGLCLDLSKPFTGR